MSGSGRDSRGTNSKKADLKFYEKVIGNGIQGEDPRGKSDLMKIGIELRFLYREDILYMAGNVSYLEAERLLTKRRREA